VLGKLGPGQRRRSSGLTFRIDRSQIKENTDGSIEVPAQLTRTGVFEYRRGDETVRELRSEDEVFNQDALDSLQGSYLTRDHPPEFLTSDNWKDYAKGVVSHVTVNPPFVEGRLRVWDSDLRHQVVKGYLTEVSCGYACIPKEVTDSDEADVLQSQIRYNHAAVGPAGWSRLGTQLRLDKKDNEVLEHFNEDQNMDELKEALEPVLEAIKGLEEKYDSLSQTLDASVKADEAEEKQDSSPIEHPVELPEGETVDSLIDQRAREIASLELRARDAHREIFPKAVVSPELCGRQLCEEVIRTSDSKFSSKDTDELSGLVREAELVSWKQRADREENNRSDRAGTAARLREQLLAPVPAKALQTKQSALRERILG